VLSTVITPVIDGVKQFITGIHVNADDFINHPFITTKTQIIDKCIDYVAEQNFGSIFGWLIGICLIARFLTLLPILPVTKVLYNKMTTGYDIGLFNAIVATGFQNLLLSLILTVCTAALDAALFVTAGILMHLCVIGGIPLLIPLVIILWLCGESARMCLFSQWVPNICASQSKNIFNAIKTSAKGTFKKFRKNFLCILTVNAIIFGVISTTFLPTATVIPFLSIPAFIVLYCALTLTLYFSYHEQKYYTDNGTTVYTPTKLF
jgi:hypothetical protein